MIRHIVCFSALLVAILAASASAAPPRLKAAAQNAQDWRPLSDMPGEVGKCVFTSIKAVGYRLEDDADSGVSIQFANGGYQTSYSPNGAVSASRPGDAVKFCLVSKPKRCPPGDNRGRVYKTTNLRTNKSWTLPDSQHECGGT